MTQTGPLRPQLYTVSLMIARWGLVLCFFFIGLIKFTSEEAKGIQPLVGHSPFMSWMYALWSTQTVSNIFGVIELVTAALLLAGIWSARLSLAGGLAAAVAFLCTVSFLFSTPGAIVWSGGFPQLGGTGQFLVKDVTLLGASLLIAVTAREQILQTEQPAA